MKISKVLAFLGWVFCSLAPSAAKAEIHVVQVLDDNPIPAEIHIKTGDTVQWKTAEFNNHPHNVVADDGSWTSGEPAYQWEYARQFDSPGDFRYYCSRHSLPGEEIYIKDNGRVVVESAGGNDPPFAINAAISDAWYNPDTNGQGFFIIVWEASQFIFLSWFTFDLERPDGAIEALLGDPGHRWLTAQGSFEGGTAELELYLTSGGVFDAAEPAVDESLPIGSITLSWTNCSQGLLAYQIPSLGLSGNIPIQRIVSDNVAACEAAQHASR